MPGLLLMVRGDGQAWMVVPCDEILGPPHELLQAPKFRMDDYDFENGFSMFRNSSGISEEFRKN